MSEIVAPNRSDELVEQQRTGTFRLLNWIESVTSRISAIFARTMRLPRSVNSADSMAVSDAGILADATSAAFAIALPSAAGVAGYDFYVVKTDATANVVTLTGTVSGTVNPTITAQWQSRHFVSDGTTFTEI